jgi:hypothetical protein
VCVKWFRTIQHNYYIRGGHLSIRVGRLGMDTWGLGPFTPMPGTKANKQDGHMLRHRGGYSTGWWPCQGLLPYHRPDFSGGLSSNLSRVRLNILNKESQAMGPPAKFPLEGWSAKYRVCQIQNSNSWKFSLPPFSLSSHSLTQVCIHASSYFILIYRSSCKQTILDLTFSQCTHIKHFICWKGVMKVKWNK